LVVWAGVGVVAPSGSGLLFATFVFGAVVFAVLTATAVLVSVEPPQAPRRAADSKITIENLLFI
jgi:hypothetical protein